MRLRLIDLNTPWFWLTAFFYQKRYGKPWFEIALWKPHTWQKWWLNVYKWEQIPMEQPMECVPAAAPDPAKGRSLSHE